MRSPAPAATDYVRRASYITNNEGSNGHQGDNQPVDRRAQQARQGHPGAPSARGLIDPRGSSDPAQSGAAAQDARPATTNGANANGANANGKALTPDKIIKLVTVDGVPASKIREQTGGSANAVLRVLKQLETDGAVSRTGSRRSTKWHLTNH